jgi:pilus assembly protein CpaC
LVVLVTPHLVKPVSASAVRLPTDTYVDPTDYEFYLLGLDQGRNSKKAPAAPSGAPLPPGFGNQPVQ